MSYTRLDFLVAAAGCLRYSSQSANSLLGFHQRGEADPRLKWAFFAPFRCVVTPRVHAALAANVERALRPGPADHPLGEPLLLELRGLVMLRDSDESTLKSASAALSAIADEWNAAL